MSKIKFIRDGNIVMSNSNHFIELAQYGRYAVLMRFYGGGEEKPNHKRLDFQAYVVAGGYNPNDGTWQGGEYFNDLFDAVDFAKSKSDRSHISYDRMSEIATKAIDGLFEDDSESAYEYCENEIEMNEEEIEYFGIEEKYSEEE